LRESRWFDERDDCKNCPSTRPSFALAQGTIRRGAPDARPAMSEPRESKLAEACHERAKGHERDSISEAGVRRAEKSTAIALRLARGLRSLRAPFASLAPLASRMVEAPGFAPGSENTSSQDSTMRIRLCGVAPDVKRRKNRQAPTPKTSRR